jgi:hypothetical protein
MVVGNGRSPPGSHLRLNGDKQMIQNAKRAKKLVQCGKAGCGTGALM